jgi:isoaspartyl peptidase/L-asparaginase-like protein (Ntn-hydrolase superfamily)
MPTTKLPPHPLLGGESRSAGARQAACDRVVCDGPPEQVAIEVIRYLKPRLNGNGGIILLDAKGRFGIAHNTPRMAWAVKTAQLEKLGAERKADAI